MDKKQLYLCNKVAAQLAGLLYLEECCGCCMWTKDGKLHREDGPAVKYCLTKKCIRSNNLDKKKEIWYQNGKIHRDIFLPAITYENSDREYWKNNNWYYKCSGDSVIVRIEW